MAKVVQLNRNGELSRVLSQAVGVDMIRFVKGDDLAPQKRRMKPCPETRVSDWAEMSVPALSGPHSSRPWAHSLRNLVQPSHRLVS